MPLNVQILRDGEEPEGIVWDGFTLSCVYTAAHIEGDPRAEYQDGKTYGDLPEGKWVDFSWAPIYYLETKPRLVKRGEQVLKCDHTFDGGNGRTLELKAGDVLRAWRSSAA